MYRWITKGSWLNYARIVTLFEPGVMLAFCFRRPGPQHRRSTQEPEKSFFSLDVFAGKLIVVI
jgi:hypothetical protein